MKPGHGWQDLCRWPLSNTTYKAVSPLPRGTKGNSLQGSSTYLDDISIINDVYFDNILTSDTEAAFLDLLLSISNDSVST